MHLVLLNRLEGVSLPRNSMVRLIDHPDMAVAVYRGRNATKQHQLKRGQILQERIRNPNTKT